ncbi:thioredoxin domain-containing protein, partial [Pseudomonas aeruginosa]|nr:thioredoxin domain-containing protein [Pseudomonas aeruginosa]
MRIPRFAPPRTVLVAALLVAAALTTAAWLALRPPSPPAEPASPSAEATLTPATAPAGPPWLYGRADARFTVVGYADLECPYCRAYFPALKRWIDAHPEVNWQWHHL